MPPNVARLRALRLRYMQGKATIWRATSTPDEVGGQTEEWDEVSSGVPCTYRSGVGRSFEWQRGSEVMLENAWLVQLEVGTDVQRADRIEIENLDKMLEVTSPLPQTWEVALGVICKEVSDELLGE